MLLPLAGGSGTVVNLGELMMILELHRQGLKVSAIARQLGIDRKTVAKYIARGLEPPAYGPRPPRSRATDPFVPYLRERLSAYPGLTAVRLWRELKERGFTGAYTAVKRGVAMIRPPPPPPIEGRFETPPGEQAQVDLARFEVAFTDEPGGQAHCVAVLPSAGPLAPDLGPARPAPRPADHPALPYRRVRSDRRGSPRDPL